MDDSGPRDAIALQMPLQIPSELEQKRLEIKKLWRNIERLLSNWKKARTLERRLSRLKACENTCMEGLSLDWNPEKQKATMKHLRWMLKFAKARVEKTSERALARIDLLIVLMQGLDV